MPETETDCDVKQSMMLICLHVWCCDCELAYDVLSNDDEVWVEPQRGWVRASTIRSRAHVVSTLITSNLNIDAVRPQHRCGAASWSKHCCEFV